MDEHVRGFFDSVHSSMENSEAFSKIKALCVFLQDVAVCSLTINLAKNNGKCRVVYINVAASFSVYRKNESLLMLVLE